MIESWFSSNMAMNSFFALEPQPGAYVTYHDHAAALFSIVIAFFASAVSLELISQFHNVERGRRSWLFLGAFTLGGGIWAMHFVGMMAFHIDIPIGFEFWRTLLSFLVALIFVWVALSLVCRCKRSKPAIFAIGMYLGTGIAAMHYIGMSAVRAEAVIAYTPGLFALSILIALGAATFAVWASGGLAASEGGNGLFKKALSTMAMTAAIPGMHYTGMAAAVFTPAPGAHDPSEHMSAGQLMLPVTLFALLIFGISYAVSAYHKAQTEALRIRHGRLEVAHLFLRQLMASLPAPIFFRDVMGKYIAVNSPFRELFGLEEGWIEGKTADQFSQAQGQAQLAQLDGLASKILEANGGSGSFEISITLPNGSQRDFMAVVSSFRDKEGRPAGNAGALTDLTEMKLIHRQLIQARDEARAATRLKDQFVNLVSHDLRSPLSAIKTMVSLLAASSLREDQRADMIRRLGLVTEGMVELIDELLDVSRLQTGAVKPEKRLLLARPLVENLIENVRPMAERKGVAIFNETPADLKIFADRRLFAEVVANLLSNAVKFSKQGGMVAIHAPQDGKSALVVEDSGVGINPKIVPDLFKKEVKTTTPGTGGEKGTGLGLPFCMDIMKAHGGGVRVETEEGRGSAFHLILPPIRPVIMLVDDQEAQRELMKKAISEAYEVDFLEASNGREAVSALETQKPLLIISDIQMPEMDGLDLLIHVRERSELRDIPVIIATSSASSSNPEEIDLRSKAFELGADDYITKPVNKADLLPRLRKVLYKE